MMMMRVLLSMQESYTPRRPRRPFLCVQVSSGSAVGARA